MGSKHASAPRQGSCPDVAYRPYKVYNDGVWSVDIELIADWLASLDDDSREQVVAAIELLEDRGPQLWTAHRRHGDTSRHRNMKELRPGRLGVPELRILFAFDPKRAAIMLIAGNKAGNWVRWYKKNIPLADDLFDDHLRALRKMSKE